MRYIIYGAGGIGGGIGAQLVQAGRDVILIGRGTHLERIQARGLEVSTPEGRTTYPIPAVGHPSEITFTEDDVVLFTMKSQDTAQALTDLRDAATSRVPVVLAQNGVANERMAARRFQRVYAMLVFMPATYLEPGAIVLNATPTRGVLDAGRFPTGTDALIEEVCADLVEASFLSDADPEVMRLKYGKLLLNLGNAVQALCGIDAKMREVISLLRREARACFEAAGIDYVHPRELYEMRAGKFELKPIDGESRQGGSTWQSLMRGQRRIEVDFLNGEIVLMGVEHGIPTPCNRLVRDLAIEAALEGRAPGHITVEEILRRAEKDSG